MGDEPADDQAEPEEKMLTIKIAVKGARSVGLEPPQEESAEGGEPPPEEGEAEKPWLSLVSFEWPGEEAPIESETVSGAGEPEYNLEKEFTMPHNQETLDFLAVTTLNVKLLVCKTEIGKSGEPERVEGTHPNCDPKPPKASCVFPCRA